MPGSRDAYDAVTDIARAPAAASAVDDLIADSVPLVDGVATSPDAVTSLPSAADLDIETLSSATGDVVEFAVEGLSAPNRSGDAVVASTGEGSSIVASATETGVQVVQVAETPQAATLTLATSTPEGATWVPQDDGSLLLRPADQAADPLMAVDAPWAVDAEGRALPTAYTVDADGTITQHVDTTGAVFPVVSDPSAWWWTKHITVCVAQVASIVVPGKAVAIAAKLASLAAKSEKARKAKAAIDSLGGFTEAMKKVATYIKTKGSGLSKTNKERVQNLLSQGSAIIVDVLGLGGCWEIYKEVG
ncbi:hypothetical protein [Xylanimonas ulmi]|uniref:hypothetical protein n=1 Tax=Xylanimonas ulmi TaxID=228973 RepID=UPI0013EE7BC2|nr:hypothetical protein [Xylanibacterium ulmi]